MGLLDKIHKLFKTNTHKLKVILAKDITEEVDFVEIIEDFGDTIDDHFTRRFIYPLHDARDAIQNDKDPKKALNAMRKAKITIPELEKFFDKEIFNGSTKLRKVPLKEVLKQRNRYSYTNPEDAYNTIEVILAESLFEFGIGELIESKIIKVLTDAGMDNNDITNYIIDRVYNKIPKEWHPVLKYCDEIDTMRISVMKKYKNLCVHLMGLSGKYFNDAVEKYYDPKK